jgi:hypothetical protein
MKFTSMVKSNPDLEARSQTQSESQRKEQMAAMGIFNEELRPSREGKRVRLDGKSRRKR